MTNEKYPKPATSYFSDLDQRRNESYLLEKRLASKLEFKLADRLRRGGLEVVMDMHLRTPEEKNPKNFINRYADIFIPSKDLIVEIDGSIHHSTKAQRERDSRKNKAIVQTGIFRILRLVYEIPDDLIYGNKKPSKRGIVREAYEKDEAVWIEEAFEKILNYQDITYLNHSPLILELEG